MSSLVHSIGKIFQPLLDAVGGVLAFFYSVIPNYPIDVALLTIVIMALLTPLTVKSTKNMAAMQALGPEMKKLQQKYKGAENRALMNEEMMKLYKEHNVNPASGCLPMLLQMPAFFILYSVIRGITNTVSKGAPIPYSPHKCAEAVCAVPRYLGQNTSMYQDIVKAHGQLNSFGMNFSEKLLSHHSSIWVAIPFLLLVLGSVGLQYLQMSRLNARNPQAAQANPQAAMLQKYMPLIFGLIYLNVAAILNVYFIVSSAIRIGTQEVLFRKGIVAGPPAPPKAGAAGGAAKGGGGPKGQANDRTEKALPKSKASGANGATKVPAAGSGTNGTGKGRRGAPAARDGAGAVVSAKATTKATNASNGSNGKKTTGSATGKGPGSTTGRSDNGSNGAVPSDEDDTASSKEHPRSKAKRQRKAR
jgi:YidC/Oxa1 family membrane protein insertase